MIDLEKYKNGFFRYVTLNLFQRLMILSSTLKTTVWLIFIRMKKAMRKEDVMLKQVQHDSSIKLLQKITFLFLLLFLNIISAQENMNLQRFYDLIEDSNPQLKIAEIQYNLGQIEQLRAKGFLDPEITSNLTEKNFEDKRYYRLFDAQMRIPLHYGIDIVGGYQNSLGTYLNPQEKTPENGLFNLGIEANVLQGLFVNAIRMNRREAENNAEMYRQISQKTKNQFYFSAGYAYLDWEENQALIQLYEDVVDLSELYFTQTRETFLLGEKTAIDTLESHIAWQDWKARTENLRITETKLAQNLNFYLFEDARASFFQFSGNLSQVEANAQNIDVTSLPEIREKEEKLNAYQWQGRLKREKLKPKLKVKFSPLVSNAPEGDYAFDMNNYKWGFGFSYNIFNRLAKADLQENQAKQELIKWETELKKTELQTKLNASISNIDNLENQYNYWQNIAQDYKKLLDGEQIKFDYGESSVFLLTKRQEKWIQTQKKALGVYYKWQKEKLYYLYLSNQIMDGFGLE